MTRAWSDGLRGRREQQDKEEEGEEKEREGGDRPRDAFLYGGRSMLDDESQRSKDVIFCG